MVASEPDAGPPRCIAITGPTATGKTELALAVAREFPVEIISMDSAMVYRGMDIGTAKPDSATLARVPHHLIDILDPEQSYSAGRFAVDAASAIAEIRARNRIPLLVGGTMLYLKALRDGIATLPERDAAVRAEIDARAEVSGWQALHAELAEIDPESARRIEPADRQRIQRALEVHRLTGKTLSALVAETPASGIEVETIALVPGDRAALADRIERRFAVMVEQGLIDEVRRLRQRPGLDANAASMRAVGYRQIWAWLEGQLELGEALERAVTATRQLAKRQLTWLRHDSRAQVFDPDDSALLDMLRARIEGRQYRA